MKLLMISAHTDDAEIGCFVLTKKLSKYMEIFHICISKAQESILYDKGFDEESTSNEWYKVQEKRGFDKNNIFLLNYPVRRFNEHRQEILDDLIKYKKIIKPDIILTNEKENRHQDHSQLGFETRRAFRKKTIICYESPTYMLQKPNFFIPCTKVDISEKIFVHAMFKSQICKKDYPNMIEHLASVRGSMIDVDYAEAFYIDNFILEFDKIKEIINK